MNTGALFFIKKYSRTFVNHTIRYSGMPTFLLNNETIRTDLPPGMTLLDFIRYHRHLNGTKCGCREGDCGACTVLVGEQAGETVTYRSMTSCLTPLANVLGKHVVTVEGINPPGPDDLTPVQQALVDESGTQCGFCTVGFVMSLTGFCLENAEKSPERAIAAIDGNICRCTGYKSIERAAARLTRLLETQNGLRSLAFAIDAGIVPAYFSDIPVRLKSLHQKDTSTGQTPARSLVRIAGCTDLYVQRPEELLHAPAQHLFDNPLLRGIRQSGDYIEIGGASTVTDLGNSPLLLELFPALPQHLKLISSTPIRNMATVAGNIVNASPIGDLSVWLLALDASLVLVNGGSREIPLREADSPKRTQNHTKVNGGQREIPLREFYLGYKILAKTADEVIETIRFRKPSGHYFFTFEKVSKRTHLDIATVNAAIFFQLENNTLQDVRLSAGGVAPTPLFLKKTATFLNGKTLPRAIAECWSEGNGILQSEISPISDVRGSEEYKRLLLRQLLIAGLAGLGGLGGRIF